MADFGAPASANYNAPDGLQTLGNLMGLQSKKLTIQGQQQGLQGQAADVQMKQQDASQRSAAAQFFQNFDLSKHVKDDGTLDLDSALTSPELKATGDLAPDLAQKLVGIKNSQLQAKQGLVNLNATSRDQFRQNIGGLSSDPDVVAGNNTGRGKVLDEIQRFAQGGPDEARIAQIYAPVLQNAAPKSLGTVMKDIHLQAISAGSQAEATKPGGATVTTPGGNVGIVNTNPNAPQPVGSQVGQSVPQGIAPQLTSLPTGQVGAVAPGGRSVSPLAGANPTAPQMAAATGQAQAITGRVAQAQEQANSTVQTQDALNRASHILESGSAANAGASFDTRKYLKNFLAGVGIDTQGADDTNSLVKNLARYEASRATAAGLGHTDAARELAHTGSPNTAIDNKALLGIVKQSLATEKALAAYGNAQAKTNDPAEWSKNEAKFRSIPNLIQGYEYGLSKSPQEADQFLAKHGLSREDMKNTRTQIKAFEAQ